MMKISVIVPCYNCEKTIEKCLDSLFNQTYYEVEVIAVDDGSSDETLNRLNEIAQKESRLKVYHQKNAGPSSARNLGLLKSTGEYIAFVDSDDFIRIDAYEIMMKYACEKKADLVICDYVCVYSDGSKKVMKHVLPEDLFCKKEIIDNLISQFYGGDATGLASLWNKLYKKSFINDMQFDVSLYRGEDWWFNFKLYEKANRISTVHEALYYYSQESQNSIMRRLDSNYYKEWKYAKQYLTKKNKDYGFNYDKDLACKEILQNIHSLLIVMIKRGEDIKDIIKDSFYNEIIEYDKYTSVIAKIGHLIHKCSIKLEIVFYKILSFYYYG